MFNPRRLKALKKGMSSHAIDQAVYVRYLLGVLAESVNHSIYVIVSGFGGCPFINLQRLLWSWYSV